MANPAAAPYRSPWLYACAPFQIADGLWYVGNTSVSSHLFDTGAGLLLLDTTYGETGYLLIESIREAGFDPHDLRWILHTHGHIDHFGATRLLAEKYGAETFMPEIDLPLLKERADLNWCAEFGLPYEPPYDYAFVPDAAVRVGDVLRFGALTVDCHSAAGHTPGTMAYVFHLPCGLRAAMHGGIGLNTLTAAYARRFGLGNSWREAYVRSLAGLRDLPVDIVLGNHPEQSDTFGKLARRTAAENPFVDPGEWNRFLAETRRRYDEFAAADPI